MTEKELQEYIQLHYPKENERCEWKAFSNLTHDVSGHKGADVISYVSAIANMRGGQLVIGVEDNTLSIIGIQNFHDYTPENLPARMAGNCTHLITEGLYVENITTTDTDKTVWIIHIPKHVPRKPVIAHKQPWQRLGDNIVKLTPEREAMILSELLSNLEDWSAVIIPDATIEDLDPSAISKARENYKNKFPEQAAEVDIWNDITFLNKAKVTIKDKITRTAIILLGKSESEHFVSPADAKIRWILKDARDIEKDYQIFTCPFLLAVDQVYTRIRNLKYRYLKEGTLFPEEVQQYEPFVIREALNNCIAHQDYTLAGRINVVEMEDQLVFSNLGSFIPGTVEQVIKQNAPEEQYRNRFLVAAMFNLKMVDTIGSGIRRMYEYQRQRFFPLPEYEISPKRISVTIAGKVLDIKYARTLARNPGLNLQEIIMLDKVQKKKILSETEIEHLRSKGLIEGRKPNFHISSDVAEKTNLKADYIKARGLKDDHFKKLILEYLDKYKQASKEDIDKLLLDILPGVLDEKQRKNKIHNLIYAMSKKDKTIINQGTNRRPIWILVSKK